MRSFSFTKPQQSGSMGQFQAPKLQQLQNKLDRSG